MMPAFELARDLLADRLRLRAAWCRAKSLEPGECPERWLTRALECDACAEIAASLCPAYSPPAAPDMKAARASRARGA